MVLLEPASGMATGRWPPLGGWRGAPWTTWRAASSRRISADEFSPPRGGQGRSRATGRRSPAAASRATPSTRAHRALATGAGLDRDRRRRLARALSWIRSRPTTTTRTPGRSAAGRRSSTSTPMEVVDVEDHGSLPIPRSTATTATVGGAPSATTCGRSRSPSPRGRASRSTAGRCAGRSGGSASASRPREGLVLHEIGYEDDGRVRPSCYRASIAEMVVPYGDPARRRYCKNAFDIGEYGLGLLANSLELGCDCLGEIRYFDARSSTPQGEPCDAPNAICLHEEDDGMLWKHTTGAPATTRCAGPAGWSVSSIATVGNYEYGFYWYFYQDGTIEFEVKLTGIVHTAALRAGRAAARTGREVAPGVVGAATTSTSSTPGSTWTSTATANTRLRGRRAAAARGPRQPARQRVRRAADAARHASRRRSATIDPLTAPLLAGREPRRARNGIGRARRLPAGARRRTSQPFAPPRLAASRRRAALHRPPPVGDAVRPGRALSGRRVPEPARRRRRPAGVDGGRPLDRATGRRRSGTRSAPTTCRAPRTGR